MTQPHVFVETNFLFGVFRMPSKRQRDALALKAQFGTGDVKLYVPYLCFQEARNLIAKSLPSNRCSDLLEFAALRLTRAQPPGTSTKYRTQNPVPARGSGFKSHLRYFRLTAADSRGSTIGQEIGSRAFRRSDWPGPDDRNPAMRSEYQRAPPLDDAGVRSGVDCESKRHVLAQRRGPE
jgi:hypothetical protein